MRRRGRKTRPAIAPVASLQADVTRERVAQLARYGAVLEVGRSGHGTTVTRVPHPLERHLTQPQLAAALKYAHHWTQAGLAGNLQSPSMLFVVVGSEPHAGMPRSEHEAHHRQMIRAANLVVARTHAFGIIAMEHMACNAEAPLQFGYLLGHRSKPKAIAAARAILLPVLDRLAHHWGLS